MTVSRDRIIALAVLVLLIVVVWVGPVSAYFDAIGATGEQLSQRQALLQRYRLLARDPPRPAAATLGPPILFPGGPEAAAAVLLQDTVKGAAAANRIQVRSLQVLRGEAATEAAKIAIRIRAGGDAADLGRFLYTIESANPVLYPDNLQVQAPQTGSSGTAGNLEFQLDIAGFRPGDG